MAYEQNSVDTLNRKIAFLRSKLDTSRNPVERAVLEDKIAETRNMLNELCIKKDSKKEVHTHIDSHFIADKTSSNRMNVVHSKNSNDEMVIVRM